MIHVELSKDGTLKLMGSTPLETFALTEWDRQRKRGKATLMIDAECFDAKVDKMLKEADATIGKAVQLHNSEVAEFRAWRAQKRAAGANAFEVKA